MPVAASNNVIGNTAAAIITLNAGIGSNVTNVSISNNTTASVGITRGAQTVVFGTTASTAPTRPATDPGHRAERRTITVAGTTADYFCVIVPAHRSAADVEYRVTAGPDPAQAASRLMILHETVNLGGKRLEAVWRDTLPLATRPRAFARVEARTAP